MTRLKDIAARAGVSVMTVSKVLRDAPDISAATKARIRKLAQEMGYVPDTMARGLRSRTTRLLGLVISETTNPIFARMVMAIEEMAHEQGFEVILAHSLNQPEREEEVIRRLLARRIDGLFISPLYRLEPNAPIYAELLERKLPTVLLGHRAPFCDGFANVETDDSGASAAITRHLLDLGHRRIAYFAGMTTAPSAKERLDGYYRAIREAGIEPDDALIFKAGSTIREGETAGLQLLQEGTKFSAILGINDLVTIGVANVFLKQGFQIPGDISVAGFGNILISEHYRVPLTTVRQPKFRLGVAAMELMNKLLRGEAASTVRLSAEIETRQSTACAPQ